MIYSFSVSAAAGVATIADVNLGKVSLGQTVTGTFSLNNIGDVNLSNVQFSFSISGFNLTTNKTNFNLSTANSETIQFNLKIPGSTSTGNLSLGTVNLQSTQLNKALFNAKAEITGGLNIEDLNVFINTRKSKSGSDTDVYDSKTLDFGEEDAGPGTQMRFNFQIENNFKEQDNIDINGITVKVTIKEIDDGEDFDQESDEFDLDSGKNNDLDVFFDIPYSVEEGTYDIVVDVEGDDKNGNAHKKQMNLKLKVKKDSRDIGVIGYSVFPEKIKCGGISTLTATIKNLGKKAEDHIKLEISNSDLGISSVQSNIQLDQDPFDSASEFVKKATINTDKTTKSGKYPILVKAYLENDVVWETKTVNLEVDGCEKNEASPQEPVQNKSEEEKKTIENNIQAKNFETANQSQQSEQAAAVPIIKPTTITEPTLIKNPIFWLILLGNAVLIIIIVVFLMKAIKK